MRIYTSKGARPGRRGGAAGVSRAVAAAATSVAAARHFRPATRCGVEGLEDRRLFAAGDLDPTFGAAGIRTVASLVGPDGHVAGVDVRAGKTVVAAQYKNLAADDGTQLGQVRVARLTASGALDPTFDADGLATLDLFGDVTGVVVEADQKVVVSVSFGGGQGAVLRLNADGSQDAGFGATYQFQPGVRTVPFTPSAPKLTADEKIVVGGSNTTIGSSVFTAARLTTSGKFDTSFGNTGAVILPDVEGAVNQVAVQPDGKILLGGQYRDFDSDIGTRIVRVNANGSVDPTFDYGTGFGDSDRIAGIEVGGDGRVYVGLVVHAGLGVIAPVRLTSTGVVQEQYQTLVAFSSENANLTGIRLGSDGRLTAFGYLDPSLALGGGPGDFAPAESAIRYDVDGTFDHTFGGGRGFVFGAGLAYGDLQTDNKLVTAGRAGGAAQVQRRQAAGGDASGIALSPEGLLSVEGTTGNDTVYVTESGTTQVRVLSKGIVKYFGEAAVNSIVVDANAGNDLVKVDAFGKGSRIDGYDGADTLTGGAGADTIDGGRGNDVIKGLGGNDAIGGGAGDDTVDGGAGADVLYGYSLGELFDATDFDSGTDTVTYATRTAGVTVSLSDGAGNGEAGENDYLAGFAVAIGGSGNDKLKANALTNKAVKLYGGAGNDQLTGSGGDDTLDGGAGQDSLFGMAGNDTLLGKDGFVDYLDGGTGTDKAQKDPGDATFGVEVILP